MKTSSIPTSLKSSVCCPPPPTADSHNGTKPCWRGADRLPPPGFSLGRGERSRSADRASLTGQHVALWVQQPPQLRRHGHVLWGVQCTFFLHCSSFIFVSEVLGVLLLCVFFLRSSVRGVAYVTVFNSSATRAATFRLQGYKCMLVIFVLP